MRIPSSPILFYFDMKRHYPTECHVCNETWTSRTIKTEKKAFHDLNPLRNPTSNVPLNLAQENYLRSHFFNFDGSLVRMCYDHLIEFASIGRGKVASLVKEFRLSSFGTLHDLDTLPSPNKKHKPHNKTSDEKIQELVKFCNNKSEDVPNAVGIRRYCSEIKSKRRLHVLWQHERPQLSLPWTTFHRTLTYHCGHIKVFSFYYDYSLIRLIFS